MSRTKRNYGIYQTGYKLSPWDKCWSSLHPNRDAGISPRDECLHGYDGFDPSYYYNGLPPCDYGRENFKGKTRKFFKRRYHKQARRLKIELE